MKERACRVRCCLRCDGFASFSFSRQQRVAPSLSPWTWRLRSAPCCPPRPSTRCRGPTPTTGRHRAPPGRPLPSTPGTTRTSSRSCRCSEARGEVLGETQKSADTQLGKQILVFFMATTMSEKLFFKKTEIYLIYFLSNSFMLYRFLGICS